jgi:hypothetical protein
LISKRKKEKSEGGSSKINSSFKEVGLVREKKIKEVMELPKIRKVM